VTRGKTRYLIKEMWYLVRQEKLYMLALLFFFLAVVAFFVYKVTPITVVTFIYAGV